MINMSNISNDWVPVVESTFSFNGLQPCLSNDFYSGLDNVSKATPPLNLVKMQERGSIPRHSINRGINGRSTMSNGLFIDYNLEGIIKLWTTGGHMNWLLNSSSKRGGKTLEELKLKSCIKRLDIKLNGNCSYVKPLSEAVDDITKAGVLLDWLLLKCEATKMDFSSLYEEITIYSTNSFNCLKNAIYNNSCLPLPLVHKCENDSYRYFYLVFNYGGNPKITKLNIYLFKEKKRTNIKGGIQLMNSYTNKVEGYKFYGERGFDFFLMKNETCIKKLILRHIIWGYLQSWVRKIVKLYRFGTVEQVARQLLICHGVPKDIEKLKEAAARSQTLYLLGFCQNFFLYIKFFTLNSNKRSEYSITITNVETAFVSEIPIVQYFRQYLYLNHSSEASLLKAVGHEDTIKDVQGSLYLTPPPGSRMVASPEVFAENLCVGEGFTPLIKARTVEEINSSVENVGTLIDSSVTDLPSQQCNTITKLLRDGEITAQEVKYQLFPLVRDSLDACYLANMEERSQKDNTTDEIFIRNCFSAAIASADKTKTFYVFLDQVFRSLQLNFTNSTCRRIMDLMIYEELRNKYSYVLNQDEGGLEVDAPDVETKQPKVKNLTGFIDPDNGYLKQLLQRAKDDAAQETSSQHTSVAHQYGNCINISKKNNENSHSKSMIQNKNKKKSRWKEQADECISLRAPPKNVCSDLDNLHRECLYNKVSVALLQLQDMIDLASYFKRKEELKAARKEGVKRKYKKKKDLRERVCVKKEAKVKSGTIFKILKIGRRRCEYVKVDLETLEFLFKWKFTIREGRKEISKTDSKR